MLPVVFIGQDSGNFEVSTWEKWGTRRTIVGKVWNEKWRGKRMVIAGDEEVRGKAAHIDVSDRNGCTHCFFH